MACIRKATKTCSEIGRCKSLNGRDGAPQPVKNTDLGLKCPPERTDLRADVRLDGSIDLTRSQGIPVFCKENTPFGGKFIPSLGGNKASSGISHIEI